MDQTKLTRRVLVADDDLVSRLAMEEMLQSCGALALTLVEDGASAWARLSQDGRFDLVCLDLRMPVLDGLELVERMRASPALRRVPAMLITADSDRDTAAAARRCEMQGLIVKPVSSNTSRRVLNVLAELDAAILEPSASAARRLSIDYEHYVRYVAALLRNLLSLARLAHQLEPHGALPHDVMTFERKAQVCRSAAMALGALRIEEIVGDALAAVLSGVSGAAAALELASYWFSRVSRGLLGQAPGATITAH